MTVCVGMECKATGFDHFERLRSLGLFLDNFDHFQASWVTQGPKIAQVSLRYGIDDFGSTMLEENVVSAANTSHTDQMTLGEMERLILDAGFTPQRRRYALPTRALSGFSLNWQRPRCHERALGGGFFPQRPSPCLFSTA